MFTPRGKIRHPPPHTHTLLRVPCLPPSQNAEAVEVVKDKKRRLEYRPRREAALPVLDRLENVLENAVTRLTGKELEVLLR